MTTPLPDLKPHVPPPAPGSDCCGCCEGVEATTPLEIFNRGGLSEVSYRVGEYGDFRAGLQAALSSSAWTPLRALHTRDEDDFTIGLIDAFACAADVLTFYQERIANESWLETATERISMQEMGRLVGYRLRPGVAAETWLAFAVETPPSPPAGIGNDPGNFVTGMPAAISLPLGLKVQSIPGPDEKPQTFETVEELAEARPAWNAIQPWTSEAHVPASGESEAWLAGAATHLKPGDAVVLVGTEFFQNAGSDRWDLRILTSVEPDAANDRTRIAWARGLGATNPASAPSALPFVYALRKRAAIFGHNAPDPKFIEGSGGAWSHFHINGEHNADDTSGGSVDLDSVYGDITADKPGNVAERSLVVLAKGNYNRPDENYPSGTYVELYRVGSTSELSRVDFAMSAKVTRLNVEGENLLSVFFNAVRQTTVFGKSELLPLAFRPVTTAVSGNRIPANIAADGLVAGRKLIVKGARASDGALTTMQASLVAVHPVDAARCELEISPSLPSTLRRDSIVVHANVAGASHGETVTQVLGSGDGSQSFQRFELKQLPLTYRATASETGAAAELTVRIGDVKWNERRSLYAAGPTAKAYALAFDEKERLFVDFGDGASGARLPSGVNNVRATYRKGLGGEGNVAAGRLTQLVSRPLGLKSVANPLAAEGGTDPEDESAARRTIPLTTRTLGRVVSVLDYEDFARAFSGITKAQAAVLNTRNGRMVAITLAAPDGAALTEASPVWQNLLGALRASGDPHVQVALLPYQASTFRLGLRVKCDPAFEAARVLASVEAALRARYSFAERQLSQPVQQSDVITVVQKVPGVVALDLTRLYGGTRPVEQTAVSEQVRLLASRMRVENGTARPSELLTLAAGPLDLLEEMP
ncbi:putative baseplate assembly protein [Mesorhizobium sp. BR1-1-16]|uniref:putative baseplate assembly protein n=1 Tax=Mesorhizobium sp. BR1-1-16 TaxID=2876653 RepID=UPI001CCF7D0F|nr:putative baseplate assembly protein [Mesorhizobium sp. BR1-1-16]MBZ9935668.1 putative baseplate assembly protein [Mesorhizobium sp. BR1-1-16]